MRHSNLFCPIHPLSELECPACKGKRGGKATVRKYGKNHMRKAGKKGGRPKK